MITASLFTPVFSSRLAPAFASESRFPGFVYRTEARRLRALRRDALKQPSAQY